ncbi:MAG: hypothetical protein KY476_27255, partial [Planctomycetes bacterium]|nr:hypothetical protein [Planctomycetota bacterium]
MAIVFDCPHCAATVRVADDAAGKKGRCPQCGESLLVPRVVPPAAPPTGHADAVTGEPAAPVVPQFTSAPVAPVAARLRRRRRRSTSSAVVVPLLFGAVLLGVCLWLFLSGEPELAGEVPGAWLSDFNIPPQVVDRALIDMPEDRLATALSTGRSALSLAP